jgi:hypothetical protein
MDEFLKSVNKKGSILNSVLESKTTDVNKQVDKVLAEKAKNPNIDLTSYTYLNMH